MSRFRILAVMALAAFSATAVGGKSGTPGAMTIPNQALSEALAGDRETRADVGLYRRLMELPETIVLEDGTVVSPDLQMSDGTVITLTVAPDGTIQMVEIVRPETPADRAPASLACA